MSDVLLVKACRIVALFCVFTLAADASSLDPSKTVLAVHELRLLRATFGTAACLDAKCRYLLTNAHVAMLASPYAIRGDPVVQKLLATGPDDDGAVLEPEGVETITLTPVRDLAIYELVRPMKGFEGMPFSLEPLTDGEEVEIIAFPGRTIGMEDFYRKLTVWKATYFADNVNGCLLFKYEASDRGGKIRPGSSGGIVVRNGAVVGILRGASDFMAEAVPISSLEKFLAKVNPYLHAQLFPHVAVVEPVSLDAFPPWTTPPSTPGVLERRSAEPDGVQRVREKAQVLYDSMKYLVVRQFVSWSENGRTPKMEAAYGLRVSDGVEVYTDGKHEYTGDLPFPEVKGWIEPGQLWLNAPRYANNDLSLRIRHAGLLTTPNNRPIDVYQWQAPGPESKFCEFDEVSLFPFFRHETVSDVGCHGEIWISTEGDIVRISEAYDRPLRKWSHYESIVVYGRVMLNGESHLVPTTISTRVQYGDSKMLYCDSIFSDYRLWGSRIRLVPSSETTQ